MELEYTNITDVIEGIKPKNSYLPELFGRRKGFSKPKYPGFYHVHQIKDYTVVYFDDSICKEFGASLEEIQAMGTKFQKLVIHPEDLPRVKEQLKGLVERNDEDEVMVYFQRLRLKAEDIEGYRLVITSVKLNLEDQTLVCISNVTDQLPLFSKKICNALNAKYQTSKYIKKYVLLTRREKEIFEYLVKGKTVKSIADDLFRSQRTIEQHKKNIYKKFEVNSAQQIIQIGYTLGIA